MNDEHTIFPINIKYFRIDKQTAKELIETIHIAQSEGYDYDRVQKLLDELETWVKE